MRGGGRPRRATATATAALWDFPRRRSIRVPALKSAPRACVRLPACARQLRIFPPCLLTGSFWLFLACYFLKSSLRPPPRPATQRPAFLHDTVMIKVILVANFHALSAGATAPVCVL
jgi:hypothetical protein